MGRAARELASRRHCLGALVASAAALCLALPGAAVGAGNPSPNPLWRAYSLDAGPPQDAAQPMAVVKPAPARSAAGRAATRAPVPASDVLARPNGKAAPLAVTVLFCGALAAIALLGVACGLQRWWRRLEAVAANAPSVPPPKAAPATCEITWSPGEAGAAFLATVDHPGADPDLIAESPSFGPPAGGPSPQAPATRVAHEQLMRTLEGAGWQPVGHCGDWYSVRFRRSPTSKSTKEGSYD